MRTNAKFVGYAETEQNGYQPLNDYLIENGNGIEWSDTTCECGQTECVYFHDNEGDECCIIVCDACYKNNPKEQLY